MAFVGRDRQELVADILAAYHRVDGGGGAEMVVLRAPSGVGKTRVIQEFYAELARSQGDPPYWPSQLVDLSGDWLHSRKVVYPAVVANAQDASMPWMWWGITCNRRPDGTFGQALFEHAPQLFAHGGALFERSRLASRIGGSLDVGDAVVGVLSLLGMSLAAPVVMPLTFAGVARTAWTNRDLIDRIRRRKQLRNAHDGGPSESSSFGRDEQADELVRLAVQVSTALPLVLVIEDAHWADRTLVRFLSGVLTAPRSRVLVLATMWPLEEDENAPLQVILRDESTGVNRRVIDLQDLQSGDLADLVQAEFEEIGGSGQLSQDVVAGFLDAVRGSPLAVRISFGSPRVRQSVQDGTFNVHTVAAMPRGAEQALERYWDELPLSIRQILMCASVAGAQFPQSPIVSASYAVTSDPPAQMSAAVRRGVVRDLEGLVGVFADPVFHRVAAAAAGEELSQRSVLEIAEQLAEYALSVEGSDFPAECAWSVHIALAQEGLVDSRSAATSALSLARLANDRFDHEGALHLLELIYSLDKEPPFEIEAHARIGYASIIGDLGRHEESIAVLEGLLGQPEMSAADAGDLRMEARRLVARQTGALGEHEAAIRLLEEIESEMVRSSWPTRSVIDIRSLIAEHLSRSGDYADAVALYSELVRIAAEEFGEGDVLALMMKNNLSAALSEAGREQEAVVVADDLIPALIEQFGEGHPFVLSARQNRAICLGPLGRQDEAIEELRSIYAGRCGILGELHPATLQSLDSLATELGLSDGNEEEALALVSQVTEARQMVLGHDHPSALASAANLAALLSHLERFDESVEILESVAEAHLRNLGPSHPETAKVLSDLAVDLNALGDHEKALLVIRRVIERRGPGSGLSAVPLFEDLMTYGLALLGSGKPHEARAQIASAADLPDLSEGQLLSARWWIAYCYGAAGQHDAAVDGFRQLWASGHVDTDLHPREMVRMLLGWAHSELLLGEAERAVRVWKEAAAEAEDALGPLHPSTVSALSHLANGLGEIGNASAAVALHREVLRRLEDSNGPIELVRNQLRGLAVDLEASGDGEAAERAWKEFEMLGEKTDSERVVLGSQCGSASQIQRLRLKYTKRKASDVRMRTHENP